MARRAFVKRGLRDFRFEGHPGFQCYQVVRRRSYARLRRKVAARAFCAKPAFLACLQRVAAVACKMQVLFAMPAVTRFAMSPCTIGIHASAQVALGVATPCDSCSCS